MMVRWSEMWAKREEMERLSDHRCDIVEQPERTQRDEVEELGEADQTTPRQRDPDVVSQTKDLRRSGQDR